jgi:hypothetical protein
MSFNTSRSEIDGGDLGLEVGELGPVSVEELYAGTETEVTRS